MGFPWRGRGRRGGAGVEGEGVYCYVYVCTAWVDSFKAFAVDYSQGACMCVCVACLLACFRRWTHTHTRKDRTLFPPLGLDGLCTPIASGAQARKGSQGRLRTIAWTKEENRHKHEQHERTLESRGKPVSGFAVRLVTCPPWLRLTRHALHTRGPVEIFSLGNGSV
jgi:hypothetical protein